MDFINKIIYNLTVVHPLHTLIVHFPVALISSALFFIARRSSNPVSRPSWI